MKKMLFVLAVFLLGILACPAAADEPLRISPAPISPAPVEDCETCAEVLIEPVPLDMVVKFIMFGKFGDDKIGLLSSFVHALKEEPVSFYMYTVSFSPGYHGDGNMHDSQMLSAAKNPTWTVPECRFTAETGYVYAGWRIYENHVYPGEQIVLTEYNTIATAIWKAAELFFSTLLIG